RTGSPKWLEKTMKLDGNDLWEAKLSFKNIGLYEFTIKAWIDVFKTWQNHLIKKREAGQSIDIMMKVGVKLIHDSIVHASDEQKKDLELWYNKLNGAKAEKVLDLAISEELCQLINSCIDHNKVTVYEKNMPLSIERKQALFCAWYELFPRSWSPEAGKHGTFKDCERLLPEIARMGFDIIYFPPIHPIGVDKRKGKNNAIICEASDPGSPWAVGNKQGGHKDIHPELGTLQDFKHFVKQAGEYGMEIALDIAFQCSPNHPYIKQHPDWFLWRPDGTIQYAENPPKKYEDIVPINFETKDWKGLYKELKSVFLYWIKQGVKVFRVDNPHTKPFHFWEVTFGDIKKKYPDVLFLAEAFTRPKIMYRLAKLGFTQSYTYFTWRNTPEEFVEYMEELTTEPVKSFFQPNFWPNTPDILPESLEHKGRSAFITRFILASTLSTSYGIYGPAFELLENEPFPGREEYLDNEKYEIKNWDWDKPDNIKDIISTVNRLRRENPALQDRNNISFIPSTNAEFLVSVKATDDLSNIIVTVVNFDPDHTQSGFITLDLESLGINDGEPYIMFDLLHDKKYTWTGAKNYVELGPEGAIAHIFRLHKKY
ncbi:MAG: DUF3416 domain-containing protein, partial [Fibrobacteria bacterium]|nr:DUF3416 domain-containing protein [Fibrobacteria bacterium]